MVLLPDEYCTWILQTLHCLKQEKLIDSNSKWAELEQIAYAVVHQMKTINQAVLEVSPDAPLTTTLYESTIADLGLEQASTLPLLSYRSRHQESKMQADIRSDNSESEHRGRGTMLAKVLRRSANSKGLLRYLAALGRSLCGAAFETWVHEAKSGSPHIMALLVHSLESPDFIDDASKLILLLSIMLLPR